MGDAVPVKTKVPFNAIVDVWSTRNKFYNNIGSRLTVVSHVANKSSHIITTEVYIY